MTVETPIAAAGDDATVTVAATAAQACSPAVPVGVAAPPAAVSALAERQAVHVNRTADDPPQIRGPPAPLETPTSPCATAGGGSASPGGASGDRDCAIHGDAIAFELADSHVVFAPHGSDHVTPAPANAAARAPPIA